MARLTSDQNLLSLKIPRINCEHGVATGVLCSQSPRTAESVEVDLEHQTIETLMSMKFESQERRSQESHDQNQVQHDPPKKQPATSDPVGAETQLLPREAVTFSTQVAAASYWHQMQLRQLQSLYGQYPIGYSLMQPMQASPTLAPMHVPLMQAGPAMPFWEGAVYEAWRAERRKEEIEHAQRMENLAQILSAFPTQNSSACPVSVPSLVHDYMSAQHKTQASTTSISPPQKKMELCGKAPEIIKQEVVGLAGLQERIHQEMSGTQEKMLVAPPTSTSPLCYKKRRWNMIGKQEDPPQEQDSCGAEPAEEKAKEDPDDLSKKPYRSCEFKECKTTRHFGFPGEKARCCFVHRKDGMVNLSLRTCKECTRTASYGYLPGRKKQYCAGHKKEGTVNLSLRKCNFQECNKTANYGYVGERLKYCSAHKMDNMRLRRSWAKSATKG